MGARPASLDMDEPLISARSILLHLAYRGPIRCCTRI
jgi:hypothetical protein